MIRIGLFRFLRDLNVSCCKVELSLGFAIGICLPARAPVDFAISQPVLIAAEAFEQRKGEFQDPALDRLVGDIETALRQQVFNVPVAQRKAQIESDGLPYHIGWEVVMGVRDR